MKKKIILISSLLFMALGGCAPKGESSVVDSSNQSASSSQETIVEATFSLAIVNDEAILLKGNGKAANVVNIPSTYEGKPVTRIAANAFKDFTKIKSIVIPEGVKTIDEYAFYGCTNLVDISLPSSLVKIGNYAFAILPYIESIVIPEGVKEIGSQVFACDEALKNISLPSSLNTFGGSLFVGCSSLKYVTSNGVDYLGNENNPYLFAARRTPKNVSPTSISLNEHTVFVGGSAFEKDSSIQEVTLSSHLKVIGSMAFAATSITSISLPATLERIGEYAFEGCSKLETCLVTGDNLKVIEHEAFSGASLLKTIRIPKSIEEIGFYAFKKFDNSSAMQYNSKDGGLYLGNEENPYQAFIQLEDNTVTSFTLDPNVSVIASQAFYMSKITSLEIPSKVIGIGDSAFDSSSLTSMVIPENVKYLGDSVFNTCSALTSLSILAPTEEIGSGFLQSCSALTSFKIPSTVKKLGSSILDRDTSLTSIVIPENVIEASARAIADVPNLVVFIESATKPVLFSNSWYKNIGKVYYGNEWSYVDGVPTINQ